MIALLIIIYFAFISLGLPDSLLGSAWPSMYEDFGVAISSAGIISMIIAAGTIVSSLMSHRLICKIGTNFVTIISVGMTAIALLGISFSGSFIAVCLWAIPLGIGAGSIDVALNNFVALHYKAVHMNWLHCFWGLGAIIGPIIISASLSQSGEWSSGYRLISFIQFGLTALLILSIPLWKKAGDRAGIEKSDEKHAPFSIIKLIKLPKAKPTLIAFFCYCALEQTVMLWGSSYLVTARHIREDAAAGWISLFFAGITFGRFLSGILSLKLTQKHLIRAGQVLIAMGILLMLIPSANQFIVIGLFFVGLGCAPIYPSLLYQTPDTFGKTYAQAIMGIQMASAYIGITFMPPLFGLLAGLFGYGIFPVYLGVLLIVMVIMVGMIYTKTSNTKNHDRIE